MDRRWSLSISGYRFPHSSHEQIIEVCRCAGFSGVEANATFVADRQQPEIEDLAGQYGAAGLSLDSFHLPMGGEADVACFYETTRRRAVEQNMELIEKAAWLGCRVLVMHPATSGFDVEAEGLDRFLACLARSLDELLPHAEACGVSIALENMLPAPGAPRFGSAPEHFTMFAREFDHPHLGFCLDTGHAQVSNDHAGPGEFMDAMGERLIAFHLQDNAGDRDSHLAPGRGLIDWEVVFRRMTAMGYAHPACVEAPPFAYGPHNSYSIDAFKSLVDETLALACA